MLTYFPVDACLTKEEEYSNGTFKDTNWLWKVESSFSFNT
jgi:hypothetical protein